jgi:AraC family transcriptional regulator
MNAAGSVLRQKQAGPFRLTEKLFLPRTTLAKHEHPRAYVSFLLTGAYDEICFQEKRACSAGTVIWHPQSESHADQFYLAGGLLLNLEIDQVWLEDAAQVLSMAPRARMCRNGLAYSLGLQLYRALLGPAPGIEDVATELFSLFSSGVLDRQPPAWFYRALEMAGTIDEQWPSLASLAREAQVHPVHIARSFRRFVGCTFGDYVATIRVRKALELLLTPNRTITEVAFACGFADHAHLCRSFKKSTGLTPLAYRRTRHPDGRLIQ